MNKVVSFEKKRSLYYLGRLAFVILAFLSAAIFFFWVIVNELTETGSFSLLKILVKDQEILKEFWQDTLSVVWEELPKLEMVLGVSAITVIIAILIFSRKRVGIVRKRLANIVKYQHSK